MAPPQSLCESIQVAALIACHWPSLVRGTSFTTQGSERYWIASRSRLEQWAAWAARFETADQVRDLAPRREAQLRGLLYEVFATELLTRTWAAAATVLDRTHGHREIEPYASSVFLSHQDVRHRCMRLVVKTHRQNAEFGRSLDQIRRRAERWCDMLLSRMNRAVDVSRWAFDMDRVTDFSSSAAPDDHGDLADELMVSSLMNSRFAQDTESCLHPQLNERIVGSLLSGVRARYD